MNNTQCMYNFKSMFIFIKNVQYTYSSSQKVCLFTVYSI